MTALTPQQKERQAAARSRSSKIRMGIVGYLETLALIAKAREEGDHLTLGYKSWAEYVDAEYGEGRLRLSAEMRRKAVEELRLAGASQREIGHTLGVSPATVNADLARVQDRTPAEDEGAGQRVSDALKQAIADVDERAKTAGAGLGGPAPAPNQPDAVDTAPNHPDVTSDVPGDTESAGNTSEPEEPPGSASGCSFTAAGAVTPAAPAAPDPGVAAPAEEADAPAASSPPSSESDPAVPPSVGEGVQGGPVTSPAGPSCEKCGDPIDDDGYRRCSGCDPDGMHTAAADGTCRLCALLATVPDEYLPIQVAEGVHGLQLECRCGAVVSHLKAGMPLGIALVEAHLHHGTCQ